MLTNDFSEGGGGLNTPPPSYQKINQIIVFFSKKEDSLLIIIVSLNNKTLDTGKFSIIQLVSVKPSCSYFIDIEMSLLE